MPIYSGPNRFVYLHFSKYGTLNSQGYLVIYFRGQAKPDFAQLGFYRLALLFNIIDIVVSTLIQRPTPL